MLKREGKEKDRQIFGNKRERDKGIIKTKQENIVYIYNICRILFSLPFFKGKMKKKKKEKSKIKPCKKKNQVIYSLIS